MFLLVLTYVQFKVHSSKEINYFFCPSHIGSFSDLKTIRDNPGKANDSNPHFQNNQMYRESVESRRQSPLNQSKGTIYNIIKCFKNTKYALCARVLLNI